MIVVKVTEDQVKKLVQQIEKQVDVIKAFYHTDEETIFQETALYKVTTKFLFEERQIQNFIKQSLQAFVIGLSSCGGSLVGRQLSYLPLVSL